MRLALSFLLGLLLGACTAHMPTTPAQSQPSPSDLESMTVVLTIDDAVCSGVWVSERYILTAKHCATGLTHGEAGLYSVHADLDGSPPRMRAALLSAVDDQHDLALLFALTPPRHLVASVASDVVQGAFAHGMGHPLGLWYTYSTGIVSAVRLTDLGDGEALWVQATTPVSPGSSGGGLFDVHGRLIGISNSIFGTLRHGQSLNMFVHPAYVAAFLAANKL